MQVRLTSRGALALCTQKKEGILTNMVAVERWSRARSAAFVGIAALAAAFGFSQSARAVDNAPSGGSCMDLGDGSSGCCNGGAEPVFGANYPGGWGCVCRGGTVAQEDGANGVVCGSNPGGWGGDNGGGDPPGPGGGGGGGGGPDEEDCEESAPIMQPAGKLRTGGSEKGTRRNVAQETLVPLSAEESKAWSTYAAAHPRCPNCKGCQSDYVSCMAEEVPEFVTDCKEDWAVDLAHALCEAGHAIDGTSVEPSGFRDVCHCWGMTFDGEWIEDGPPIAGGCVFYWGPFTKIEKKICVTRYTDPAGCIPDWLNGKPGSSTTTHELTYGNPAGPAGATNEGDETQVSYNAEDGLRKACTAAGVQKGAECRSANEKCRSENSCL